MKFTNKFFILMLLSVPVLSVAMEDEVNANEQSVPIVVAQDTETFEDVYNKGDLRNVINFCLDSIVVKKILSPLEKNLVNKPFLGKYSLFNEVIEYLFSEYIKNNKEENSLRELRTFIKDAVNWFINNDFYITLKDYCQYDAIKILKLLQKRVAIALNDSCENIEVGKNDLGVSKKQFEEESKEYSFSRGKIRASELLENEIPLVNKKLRELINNPQPPFDFTNTERDYILENPARFVEFFLKAFDREVLPPFPVDGLFREKFLHILTFGVVLPGIKIFMKLCDSGLKPAKLHIDLCAQIGKRDRLERLNRYIDRQIDKLRAYGEKRSMQLNLLGKRQRKFSDVKIVTD